MTATTCTHPNIKEIDGILHCYDCEPVQHFDIVGTAAIIRIELKKAFPDTKFSVTTRRYSGGSDCSVRYTDGPPSKAVDKCIGWIAGKSFNGMDDSTHYHHSIYNGKPVSFSGYGPSISRKITNESAVHDYVRDHFKAYYGNKDSMNGDYHYFDTVAYRVVSRWDARHETIDRSIARYKVEGDGDNKPMQGYFNLIAGFAKAGR